MFDSASRISSPSSFHSSLPASMKVVVVVKVGRQGSKGSREGSDDSGGSDDRESGDGKEVVIEVIVVKPYNSILKVKHFLAIR